jgi:hypothetical protein
MLVHDLGKRAGCVTTAWRRCMRVTEAAAARDNEMVFSSLPGTAEFESAMLEPQSSRRCGRDSC